MKILFYGFGHGHIYGLYRKVAEDPEIEIAACIEEDEEMAAAAERELGIQILRDGYETWLQTDVDAVAIGKAYTLRGKAAILALQAGKHVIADKPLCTKLEELDAMEQLAESKGLQIACMLDLRYLTQSALAAEILPTLGKIHNISFTGQHFLNPVGRQKWYFEGFQGGTINDIAIHGVDLVRFITGYGVKNVTAARTWNHFAKEVPEFKDCGQFMAELENGAGFTADVSYAAPASCGFALETYWRMTFWGTKGVVEYKLKGAGKAGIDADDAALLQVALAGSDGFAPVEKKKYAVTGLGEFVKEIRGETNLLIDTAEVIRTSREVLTIQAAAQ